MVEFVEYVFFVLCFVFWVVDVSEFLKAEDVGVFVFDEIEYLVKIFVAIEELCVVAKYFDVCL